jgi:hypothetical protein
VRIIARSYSFDSGVSGQQASCGGVLVVYNEQRTMAKTVHVIPKDGQWAVKREGLKDKRMFSTQREAIESAREIAKQDTSGQLVVHGRNGQIRERDTYGMPPIQDPPGKKSTKIERAVGKITRDRLGADPLPSRA